MIKNLGKYIEEILDEFFSIGRDPEGGVTRLGYSEEEDKIHEKFKELSEKYGLIYEEDDVGNSYAYIRPEEKYHLIGSHLDSVIQGGSFDGPVGVAVGLAILRILKEEENFLPVKTVAFRCEESANFMVPMIGSSLVTGVKKFSDIKDSKNLRGETLEEIFEKKGYSKNPKLLDNVIDYVEVHIEQGRVLEYENKEVAIVTTIAGADKVVLCLKGMSEHAGATPMELRKDPLCGVAEVILECEKVGKEVSKTGVATVGYLDNKPNSLNVVPGEVKFSFDIRDINRESVYEMRNKLLEKVEEVSEKRNLQYDYKITSSEPPVNLSKRMINSLSKVGEDFKCRHMHSGAGHDCMNVNKLFDSALIFIPCKDGISHNPKEYVEIEDIKRGAELVYKYLINEN